jgi:protein TonB
MRSLVRLVLALSLVALTYGKQLPDVIVEYTGGKLVKLWNVMFIPVLESAAAPGDHEVRISVPGEVFFVRQSPYYQGFRFADIAAMTMEPRQIPGLPGIPRAEHDCATIRLETKQGLKHTGVVNAKPPGFLTPFGQCSAPLAWIPGAITGKITRAGQLSDTRFEIKDLKSVRFDVARGTCTVDSRYSMTECQWAELPGPSTLEGAGLNGRLSVNFAGAAVKLEMSQIESIRFVDAEGEVVLRGGRKTTGLWRSDFALYGTAEDGRMLHSVTSSRFSKGPEPAMRAIRFAPGLRAVEFEVDQDAIVERDGMEIARWKVGVRNKTWLTSGTHELLVKSEKAGKPEEVFSRQITVDPDREQLLRVELRGDVIPARKLYGTAPVYTQDAQTRRISGEVVLRVSVDKNGDPGNVELVEGLGYGLNESAMAAVRTWKFRPALRGGQVSDSVEIIRIKFPE